MTEGPQSISAASELRDAISKSLRDHKRTFIQLSKDEALDEDMKKYRLELLSNKVKNTVEVEKVSYEKELYGPVRRRGGKQFCGWFIVLVGIMSFAVGIDKIQIIINIIWILFGIWLIVSAVNDETAMENKRKLKAIASFTDKKLDARAKKLHQDIDKAIERLTASA